MLHIKYFNYIDKSLHKFYLNSFGLSIKLVIYDYVFNQNSSFA